MLVCPAQEGGALYTWGGESGGPGSEASQAAGEASKYQGSHHRGCLGHGDLSGRLTPTRCAVLWRSPHHTTCATSGGSARAASRREQKQQQASQGR